MALGGVSMVAGCVLIAIWADQLVTPGGWATPEALALTHILALGFATSLMAGVLYQMLPVILGSRPARARGARLAWWCFLASTAIFTGTLASGRDDLAPIGGIALTVAILGITAHAGSVMRRATRWNVVALYLVMALGCLDAIAVMGAILAVSLRTGMLEDPLALLAPKILLAVGGWLGLVLVGVSYQLVPQFNVSAARARWAWPVLGLLVSGLLLGVIAVSVHLAPPLRIAALVPYGAGAGLYLHDVIRLTRARGRPAASGITPIGQVAAAVVFVVAALAALPAIAGMQPWPQVAVTSALLGWAPLAISANGARIIPFLAWTRAGVPGAAPLAADRIPVPSRCRAADASRHRLAVSRDGDPHAVAGSCASWSGAEPGGRARAADVDRPRATGTVRPPSIEHARIAPRAGSPLDLSRRRGRASGTAAAHPVKSPPPRNTLRLSDGED